MKLIQLLIIDSVLIALYAIVFSSDALIASLLLILFSPIWIWLFMETITLLWKRFILNEQVNVVENQKSNNKGSVVVPVIALMISLLFISWALNDLGNFN